MNTKEKILIEALKLFSKKGYSAVYLSEIAEAVNIKTPSLYKHYKSKQDIFNSCIEAFTLQIEKVRNELRIPKSNNELYSYETIKEQDLINIAKSLFIFYLKDDVASNFRKMLLIERYNNKKLNDIYEDIFINKALEYEEEVFSTLIDKGIIKHNNPHTLALEFYSPIFYLLQEYDLHHDKEKIALEELSLLIHNFYEKYNIKKENYNENC